jgi:hypothetical protein
MLSYFNGSSLSKLLVTYNFFFYYQKRKYQTIVHFSGKVFPENVETMAQTTWIMIK